MVTLKEYPRLVIAKSVSGAAQSFSFLQKGLESVGKIILKKPNDRTAIANMTQAGRLD
jgi:hypothetical protein